MRFKVRELNVIGIATMSMSEKKGTSSGMRILHVGEIQGIGGLQNSIRELAAAQARRGHDVRLMLPPWISHATQQECLTHLTVAPWDPDGAADVDLIHTHGVAGFFNPTWRRASSRPRIIHSYPGTVIGIQLALKWYQNLV